MRITARAQVLNSQSSSDLFAKPKSYQVFVSTSSPDNALNSEAEPRRSRTIDAVELVQQHQAGLWRYLRAMGCDAASAEDLVQDTFVTVLRTEIEDQGEAAMASYLRTVARNLFISRQRREKRVRTVAEIEEIDSRWSEWAGDSQGDELVDALKDCLQRLSDRARQALQMRFRERRSRIDIASELHLSEHGAKNLMQRAKHQLKDCIEAKIK